MSFQKIIRPDAYDRQGLTYFEAPQLRSLSFLIHAFTTRHHGASEGCYSSLNFSIREGDPEENIRKNFQILARAFDISPQQFLAVRQVHGDRFLFVDDPAFRIPDDKPLEYDGIITNQPGLAIGVKTADCVPILLVDRVKRVIGVVHAGWRGTALRIAAKAVDCFKRHFAADTRDLVAAVGPAIGRCCYQVDTQVYQAMDTDSRNGCFHACKAEGRWMLDLPALNRLHLIGAGILPEHIDMSGLCTSCCRDLFYSHRGEQGRTGRHLNFLMLRENRA
jgi:YfiH family protein